MTPGNSSTAEYSHKANRKDSPLSASQFLASLSPVVVYAIERGLPDVDQSLKSDLDLVISKHGFLALCEMARQRDMFVSVALSYGGARLFITCPDDGVKRIDCMWNCSYLGIPICSTQRLLAGRQLDQDRELYVLTEAMQAEVIFAVKNAHRDAEKYRTLLEQYGLKVLTGTARRRWLFSQIAKHPLATFAGLCRVVLTYVARMACPTGIKVFGISAAELRKSEKLRYLFQNRIRETGRIAGFIHSRLGSELCIVKSKNQADIDLSETENLQAAEQTTLNYLRKHRSRMPLLIVALS